jgi:hypothetical protein
VTWVKWNLISVCLETVLVSVQDRCMVCAKRTVGSEIVIDAPDGTMDAGFGPFSDSTNFDARYVHGLRRMYHMLRNRCWMHPMDPLGDVCHMESHFSPFGESVSVSAR